MRGLRFVATLLLAGGLAPSPAFAAELFPSADLAVTITDNRSPEPVLAGQGSGYGPAYYPLTYSIAVRNNGTVAAQAVTISDHLPAHTTFVSLNQTSGPAFALDSPPQGGTGTARATTQTFSAGAIATFELALAVNADTPEGTALVNTARASAQSLDPNPANDSATATTRVTTAAAFWVDIHDTRELPVRAGEELTYVLAVQNNGPSDAQALVLTDPLPSRTSFVSFAQTSGPPFVLTPLPVGARAPAVVSATLGTLAKGASATFTLVLRVDQDTPHGWMLINSFTVDSATQCGSLAPAPYNTYNCGTLALFYPPDDRSHYEITFVSTLSADLAVSMSEGPDPVEAGGTLTYVVALGNNGPDRAPGIWLRSHVPPSTTLESWTQSSGPALAVDRGCCGTVSVRGDLAAGDAATFALVVRLKPETTAGTVIENSAEVMWSEASDAVPANDRAGTATQVVAGPP